MPRLTDRPFHNMHGGDETRRFPANRRDVAGRPAPTFHTAHEIAMTWGPAHSILRYEITIPKGTRCKPCGDTSAQYFVDDLTWIDRKAWPLLLHDAAHYGIRLRADEVTPG